MKHTVCFIDDKIPVAQYGEYFTDTDIISSSVIKFLLKNEGTYWGDDVVKKMCEKLTGEPEKWSVSAFTSPSFYDNYTKDTVYAPEIVIYDWDYNYEIGSRESEEHLLDILKTSYTMVFVFSSSDNIDGIKEIVNNGEFEKYSDRLLVVDKNSNNSVEQIFSTIEQKEQNNFAFAYGFEVIRNSNKAINSILSDLSVLSIEEFVSSIGFFDGNRYIATNDAFIDAIMPRYNNSLRRINTMTDIAIKKTANPPLNTIRETWAFRLFDINHDDKVRMGDIIKDYDDNYYLTVSSNCHLNEFNKKNYGYLTLVPMLKFDKDETKKIMKRNMTEPSLSSLTSNNKSPMTVIPCVPIDNRLIDFILIPKSVISFNITITSGNKCLLYSDLNDFQKVASVIDPFKSPLLQYISDNITGYGCPNFPDAMKNDLTEKIKQVQS